MFTRIVSDVPQQELGRLLWNILIDYNIPDSDISDGDCFDIE